MERYEKCIESNIYWLDKIPEKWEVVKLKYLVDSVDTGKTPPTSKIEYFENGCIDWYSPGDFTSLRLDGSKKKITEQAIIENGLALYPKNTILLIGIGATLGKVAIVNRKCYSNQQINAIVFNSKVNPYFGLYYLDSIKDIIRNESNASTMAILNQSKTKDLLFVLPSISEQNIIAKFLDDKTQQIDAIIKKKEELIEKLKEQRQAIINEVVTKGLNPNAKMKDSGIEWLGEIPEHWEVVKTKLITDLITDGAHISPDVTKEDFPFISTVDLKKGKIDWEHCLKTSSENYHYLVQNGCKPVIGDVLYSKDGTIGKTTVITEEKEFVVASSLIIVRPNTKKILPEYLEYLLRSHAAAYQIDRLLSGVALRRVSLQKFSNLVIPLPPINEQQSFLDIHAISQNNYLKSLEKISKSVDKLKQYRQSLISEAVTGKIDVRDWKKPK